MHRPSFPRVCLILAAAVTILTGPARVSRSETSDRGFITLTVNILGVARDSQNSWVSVRTDHGEFFTQAGRDFPLKQGRGTLRLDGSGRLETLFIARTTIQTTLLLSSEVDGLIVGIVQDDGAPVMDNIIMERP